MFKYCIVPSCLNSTYNMPRKLFISVPKNPEMRIKWWRALKRKSVFSLKSTLFVCEDHFNLREDLANYVRFSLMGGKLHIKKNVVPHIFTKIKTYTSQIDQKIVDTYNDNNKKFNKFAGSKQCKPNISISNSSKRMRLEPEDEEVINIHDSNIEIKEEPIQDNISVKEELENEICNNERVAEYHHEFIKTEGEHNNDITESIIKERDSGSNINVFIKSEDIDEQIQSKMDEIGIEWNTNDSNNVSIKTECKNNNDSSERNLEEVDTELKINNFTNVLIKRGCEETDEQIQSNIEQIGTEYTEMDSTNMSFKTEYNECMLSRTDENIVYIKMEHNTDDLLPENSNEIETLPYSNRNIVIVTNGFDTTENSDENIIKNNILIEETNNIITYSQNELVSVNGNRLCEENTVYGVYTNGRIQNKSPLYDNNTMLSDMHKFHGIGLFHSEHWLADWFVTCMVPQCNKTKKHNPKTRFFKSPKDNRWETWLKAICLNSDIFQHKTTYYICEDHFDLPNDVENWENYLKNREHPKIRPHVLPSFAVAKSEMEEGGYGRKSLHRYNTKKY